MIVRLAVPDGSPFLRHDEACVAAVASALRAAVRSKSVSGAAAGGALCASTGLTATTGFSTAGSPTVLGFSVSLLAAFVLAFTAAVVMGVELCVEPAVTF